jgi:hypothetical protein
VSRVEHRPEAIDALVARIASIEGDPAEVRAEANPEVPGIVARGTCYARRHGWGGRR